MARKKSLLLSDDLRKTLGTCLRNLRQIKSPKVSGKQVARELGVSAATLCDIENGKSEPSLAFIHTFAHRFKVHPNVILGVVHMKEFDFSGSVEAEVAGVIRLEDVLGPECAGELQIDLEKLGYRRG